MIALRDSGDSKQGRQPQGVQFTVTPGSISCISSPSRTGTGRSARPWELTELAAFESGSYERLTKPGSTLQNHPAIIDQRRAAKEKPPKGNRAAYHPASDGR